MVIKGGQKAASVTGSFLSGVGRSLWSTVTSLGNAVLHPTNTLKNVGKLMMQPDVGGTLPYRAATKKLEEFKNGNANQRANILGNVFGDVTQLFIGAGEIKAATKVFEITKIAEGTEVLTNAANYTKSTLKLGQEMHKVYKAAAEGIKEFRLPSGKRIDFLDIKNGTIYELKPRNPRAMKLGQKQLLKYKSELETVPEFKGIKWKTVLDTY
ncbi:MAG: hypothetical protein M3004_02845 [Bacteroidota bacterium]|nr:hypothetical protein [Bacteroidota bacterium]